MNIIDKFSPFFASLRDLPDYAREAMIELVLSERQGTLSVCYVTDQIVTFRKLVGVVPNSISVAETVRYAVDLESIGTDRVRIYHDGDKENNEVLHGYYLNGGAIVQKKKYKRGDNSVYIDRFDAEGNLISEDEREISGDRTLWRGPSEIADVADTIDLPWSVIYLAKVNADQSYIRICM